MKMTDEDLAMLLRIIDQLAALTLRSSRQVAAIYEILREKDLLYPQELDDTIREMMPVSESLQERIRELRDRYQV